LPDRPRERVSLRHVLPTPLQPLDRHGPFLVVGHILNAVGHFSQKKPQPASQLPVVPPFARIDVVSERRGQTIGFGIGVGLCAVLSLLVGLGAAAVSGWL
jgi:hypothetical protein